MTTYEWEPLDKTRIYSGIELVMSVTQIAKIRWYRCYRCDAWPIHKRYLVVTVNNIVSDVCEKCLGEFGLLQSRHRDYVLIRHTSAKIKIYQRRGLSSYSNIQVNTLVCTKL